MVDTAKFREGEVVAPANPIKVVIVDDHSLFVRGLQFLLESSPGQAFEVVGVVDDPLTVERVFRRTTPDLAIIDLVMPGRTGVDIIRVLAKEFPRVRTLVVSGAENLELVVAALRAGAHGYVPKTADPSVLLAPIMSVLQGWITVSPEVIEALLAHANRPGKKLLEDLSSNERLLWSLVARGYDASDIGAKMFVSERTAKRKVAALLTKIGAANRVDAAALAGAAGLLDLSLTHTVDGGSSQHRDG